MSVLTAAPSLVVLGIIVVLVLLIAGWRLALFALGGLLIIHNINLWSPFIETLALVISAQLLILIVGLPLGVLPARSDTAERIIRPVLDFMQAMPAFAHLPDQQPAVAVPRDAGPGPQRPAAHPDRGPATRRAGCAQ